MIRFILVQVRYLTHVSNGRIIFSYDRRIDKARRDYRSGMCPTMTMKKSGLSSHWRLVAISDFSVSQVRLRGEVHRLVAPRDQKYQSNFVEVRGCLSLTPYSHWHWSKFRNYKIVYRRYAGLFFCLCVDANDNELAYLEAIHLFVEILGRLTLFHSLCSIIDDIPSDRHIFW